MSELTIEQMVDNLIEVSQKAPYGVSRYAIEHMYVKDRKKARSALLARVTEIEAENAALRDKCIELEARLGLYHGNTMDVLQERAEKAEKMKDLFYSHIKSLNDAIDALCPLVARVIDWLPSEQFTLRANASVALDNVTDVQNRAYKLDGSFIETSRWNNE